MAQDDSRQNDRNFTRMRPKDDGNAPRKGPKFNIYWIWAIIFAVLVGFQFFGSFTPDAKPLDSEQEFRTKMLETGDVAKLVIVTNKNLVRVYIKKESLNKP
ncbi:MAG TPA: ATP-dependent metallopeptidase FtsH/Yme1/Tma family protein, partial [Flavisolibacter sp.]|nr:ATP-dependent metallopeptidase FtsH/Yme1/Tma family protein [Flavisolibacter sp.]